ncbi:MAG: hypothetical protein ACXU8N_13245 [Telluria sp.]
MTEQTNAALARDYRQGPLWMLPVPLAATWLAASMLGAPSWKLFLLGGAGWMLALVLRQPVALLASRLTSPERVQTIVGWASGPAEESMRVLLALLALRSVGDAVWAGLGWAAVEVLVVAVNGLVIAGMMTRTDEKALKVQALLRERQPPTKIAPAWAAVERCGAFLMHVGFTLLVFASPWLALVTAAVHSLTNMTAVAWVKRSVLGTEVALVVFSAAVYACGAAVNGML